jgi:hypothetical protein
MAAEVATHYSNYSAIDPEYALYAVDADTASTCGLLALAAAAAVGLKSPVYLATVTGMPSASFSHTCAWLAGGMNTSRFAFHNWDLASAAAVYASYKSCDATSDDYEFGSHIKNSWMALIEKGSLEGTDGWCRYEPSLTARSGDAEPCSTVLELTGPRAVRGLKTSVCAWWESQGVSRNWWWIN